MVKDIKDVIVIGGGAAGLFSAALLAKKGCSVTVLEHMKTVGKKLAATGNGKCNYTNLYQSSDCYRSGDPRKTERILADFGSEEILAFFSDIGIEPNVKKGRSFDRTEAAYVYPASGSGKDVVIALTESLIENGGKIKTDIFIRKILKEDASGHFHIETGKEHLYVYKAKALLIAVGGLAFPSTGSDGSFYPLLRSFGHSFKKPLPALTSLIGEKKILKELSGVRVEAKISLFKKALAEEILLSSESGELQFSERGISGIPAMQLSGLAARELDRRESLFISIDFFKEKNEKELESFLEKRRGLLRNREAGRFFSGLLSEKLSSVIQKICFPKNKKISDISDEELRTTAKVLKDFRIEIDRVGDFSQAQTTSGGIPLSEVTEYLESRFVKGLFFAGEVLDTDGLCGGYNLTWAWASAFCACRKIGEP